MKKIYQIALFIALFYLLGCEEKAPLDPVESDVQKPTIMLNSTSPRSATADICRTVEQNVVSLSSSDSLILDMTFSDNVALSQYKIDIHHNFDCHIHRSEPWKWVQIFPLEGQKVATKKVLKLPQNVSAGNYHCQIQCLDKAGNEAEFINFSLKILNVLDREKPVLTLAEPNQDSIALEKTATLTFKGTVEDNLALTGGRIDIVYFDKENKEFTANQWFFPTDGSKKTNFSIPFPQFPLLASGRYEFLIKAFDNFNNSVEKRIVVKVL